MSISLLERIERIDAKLGLAEIRANYVPTMEEYEANVSDMMMHIEQNMDTYNAFCEKFRMENPMINVTIDNLRDYEFVTRLSDKVNTITTIAFELFSLTGYGENEFYYDIYGCSQDAFATLDEILRLMNTIEI
jgi:hypothetical protein